MTRILSLTSNALVQGIHMMCRTLCASCDSCNL